MLNIEKYKDEIEAEWYQWQEDRPNYTKSECLGYAIHTVYHRHSNYSKNKIIEWLCEEYKEPILDDKEREYLSAVIKPFRKRINLIIKRESCYGKGEFLQCIVDSGVRNMRFPNFKKGTMYKGMETDKEYTLKELGL